MMNQNDDDFVNAELPDNEPESISVAPVRGAGAVKGIFNGENKGRMIAIGACAILMLGAIIWSFSSLEEEELASTGSVARGTKITAGREAATNSQEQIDAANWYNQNTLKDEQKNNPHAHPILLTQEGGAEPKPVENPFEGQTEVLNPRKISETGATQSVKPTNSQQQAAQKADAQARKANEDRLFKTLIEGEGDNSAPKLYTTNWQYAKTASGGYQGVPASGDSEIQEDDASESNSTCKVRLGRAGSMSMATTDIALNSDVEGPVSVTIRNGRLRNSQLLGKFERKEEWLRLELTTLVTPTETLKVNAIGLDMKTTLNAVAGDVDNHYLYRYGWWGVGTVLKAYGVAGEAAANNSTYVSDGVVVQDVQADSNQQLMLALGSVGQDVGEVMQDRVNRPITVTLNVGDELGVFFMEDVCSESDGEE